MAQKLPIVRDGMLTYLRDGTLVQMAVDSSDWYAWLQTASSFTFCSEQGSFTAYKEQAGNRRGRAYWRAYRTWQHKLHRAYLGQSEKLTLARLKAMAAVLSDPHGGTDVPAMQEEGDGCAHRQEDRSGVTPLMHRGTGSFSEARARVGERSQRNSIYVPSYHLPAPVTTLIGREHEQEAICTMLLHARVRLVTLTGAGGVGKTSLSLEVARAMQPHFADGVYLVLLAPIRNPSLVLPAIAQVLGIQQGGTQTLLGQMKVLLRDKQILLLLDNFEQVASAAVQVAELLAACPKLKLLVTSRARLHLAAERPFPVPPLTLPDPTRLPEHGHLAEVAAVAFFVARARAIQPGFQLTEANAEAVAKICVLLDGLPLAIELAVAYIRLFPPQALLKRLSPRLPMLTARTRDVPDRHKTLRDTIQWSYDLLEVEEQRLFRRLSIFVGGCTLEAAEAVCGLGGDASVGEALSVVDGVASLIDRSLLLQTEQEGEEPWLVMLETIREFGQECLVANGEAKVLQRAHAAYYLALAEEAEPRMTGAGMGSWLERLQREHGNLRAALAWLMKHNEQEAALRLGGALWRFWFIRGHLKEGRTELAQALAASERVEMSVRAKALCAAGALAVAQGDFAQAEVLCGQSLALFQTLDDHRGSGNSLIWLGYAAWQLSNYAVACSQLEEALALCREVGDQDGIALALGYLATVFLLQGEYERARTLAEEAVVLNRERGDTWCFWQALWVTALVISFEGDFTQAHALLEESLTLSKQEESKQSIAYTLFGLAAIATLQQDISKAQPLFKESLRLLKEVGDQQNVAQALAGLAWVALIQGDYTTARRLLEESWPLFKEAGNKWFIAGSLTGFSALAVAAEEWAWATRLAGAAEALCKAINGVWIPSIRAMQEVAIATARAQLGEEVFAAAWAEGYTMTPEQALAAKGPVTRPKASAEPSSILQAPKAPTYPDGLTAREVEVLRLLAQDLTSAQVAERLVISVNTVNFHVRSIYSKLGISSRSAATSYALKHHLV